jgi:hypothetical protein
VGDKMKKEIYFIYVVNQDVEKFSMWHEPFFSKEAVDKTLVDLIRQGWNKSNLKTCKYVLDKDASVYNQG